MITDNDRKKLRGISPLDHGSEIAERLNKAGVKSLRSKDYTSRTITRVFRGEQEDINAELAIFQYYDEVAQKKAQLKALRNKYIDCPGGDKSKN